MDLSPYPKSAWYVAGWSNDFGVGKPFAATILNEPIVIYRTDSKQLVAFEDRCVHRLAPLSKGRCEGDNLRCMYHGLLFNPNGQVIEIPGQDQIPTKAKVKTYHVVEKHSWVWVWMNDSVEPNIDLIPPAVGLDHPDYILGHGQLDYDAEARLINDNLLDFSHLSYVHANSFGVSETWAKQRSDIITLDRGIRFQRWIVNEKGPKYRGDILQDGWSSYDFIVPGILLMTTASFSVGSAEKYNFGPPDMSEAIGGVTFTSQAVTPISDKKSRYFFSWGPHKDHGDEKTRDVLMGIADQAFNEDKVIIEAQQRVINLTPNPEIMPTSADKGIILFKRLVEKIKANENNTVL